MKRNICIFEDRKNVRLTPLAHTRAVYEIRCGMESLMSKIIREYPNISVNLFCREYLKDVVKERYSYKVNDISKDGCLFINGRVVMNDPIPVSGDEEMGIMDNTLVYARLNKDNAVLLKPSSFLTDNVIKNLKTRVKVKKVNVAIIDYLWDIVHMNPEQIEKDFKKRGGGGVLKSKIYAGAHIINKKLVYVGKNTKIMPGVILNAEEGPVYIDDGVTVMPNAVIEGPVYIGRKSLVKACSKIYKGTSIGEVCKVGGEVEGSIIHGYSNKQHEGFLGHSYIGMWANLAAATDNSDLKNNYSNVRVYTEGKYIDSGSMFVGMFIGDYTKTSIGTKMYSGSIAGIMCNILGAGIPEKYIPSFVWEESEKMATYDLKKARETTKRVMGRRNKKLSRAEEKMIEDVFRFTKNERILTTK